LANAVPGLLERLINPRCIGSSDPTSTLPGPGENLECPAGYQREFSPLRDIHVGVITSSLGGHGGEHCSPAGQAFNATQNDQAHLLGTVRTGLATYQSLGFLAWDPGATKSPPGESNKASLQTSLENMVSSAGETGCGYEATLEAWYRILIDPTPPLNVVLEGGVAVLDGVDSVLLQQRAQFLRPDSLLAIVMLSDENDCSVADAGMGWLVATFSNVLDGQSFRMPRATSECAVDPNHVCCRSCADNEEAPPAGCSSLSSDAECQKGASLTAPEDTLNLRCFDQKRRFGLDLLYPVSRYINALTQASVETRDGTRVPNPLFSDLSGTGRQIRDPSLVFLAGIIGVPWQDIATPETLSGPGLEFMTAEELAAAGRWQVILGDPDNQVPPTDPLMIESVDPRTGTNPITGAALASPDSIDPQANPINGHEFYNNNPVDPSVGRDLLQFACIFPVLTPRDCSVSVSACDCGPEDTWRNLPLCNPPGGGPAGTMQYYAKVFPGLRHLNVLRDYGKNSIVTSICPKDANGDVLDQSAGYNPAMSALVDRFSSGLAP
jgi:hypothetical protein